VTSGSLPAGLVFDSATGVISGTPIAVGTSTFTVTATNGSGPDVSSVFTIVTSKPVLALTGVNPVPGLLVAALLFLSGAAFLIARRLGSSTTARSQR
jgi:hypothetical protein